MQHTDTLPREVLELAEEHGIADQLDAVLELTQRMFPGRIRVEADADPEWPSDQYIILVVEAGDQMKKFVSKQSEWRDRVVELIPQCPDVVGLSFF